MQILAAAFVDESSARVVRDALAQEHGIRGPQVAVAPLVPPEPLGDERRVILAAYVPPEATPEVVQLIEDHGGSVVADVDARLTGWQPPQGTSGSAARR
jgi:hypothetical protein